MFERTVLAALKNAAANHGQLPANLGIACVDPRLNALMEALSEQFRKLYAVRSLGGCVGHYNNASLLCDAAAAVDMLAKTVIRIFHVGHAGCAYCAAARNAVDLDAAEGPFIRLIKERGISSGADDEMHSRLQLHNIWSHPSVEARMGTGELEVLGLFVTADGDVMRYDRRRKKYVPWSPPA